MTSEDRAIERLERARERVETSPSGALKLLPAGRDLPAPLRAERGFIAAEAFRAMGFFREAERLYRRVLARTRSDEDPPLWVESALGSAAGLRCLGAVAEARRRLACARAAARASRLSVYGDRLALEEALVERAAER
ncbi:MAG: hypothetical protein ABII00_00895, partial [Elusimicrobiota bacterium]